MNCIFFINEDFDDQLYKILFDMYLTSSQYCRFAVPKSSISVPDDVDPEGLNRMVATMLNQSKL